MQSGALRLGEDGEPGQMDLSNAELVGSIPESMVAMPRLRFLPLDSLAPFRPSSPVWLGSGPEWINVK